MDSKKQCGRSIIPDQVIFITVFLIFFFIGIVGGRSIGMFTYSSKYLQINDANDNAPIVNNGQQNLLILTVDRLASAKPEVKSIWLLITFPEFSNLTLVPIYPASEESRLTTKIDLSEAFELTDDRTLDSNYSKLLHDLFYWDYYLIIDQLDLALIKGILDQSTFGNQTPNIQTSPILLPQTGREFDFSLKGQVEYWDEICSDLSQYSNIEQLEDLFNQGSPYFNTNLKWKKFSSQWSLDPSEGKHLSCDFPTLTLNSP